MSDYYQMLRRIKGLMKPKIKRHRMVPVYRKGSMHWRKAKKHEKGFSVWMDI